MSWNNVSTKRSCSDMMPIHAVRLLSGTNSACRAGHLEAQNSRIGRDRTRDMNKPRPLFCIMTTNGDVKTIWNAVRNCGKAEMDRDDAERIATELFTSCYSATVRYAAHRCGSLDLAEDIAQEAFGALYARLREGARIREPRAWLMRTVHNQICRYWRKADRQPEQAIPRIELESLPLATDSFGGSTDATHEHLEAFLARLTPREREVILLRQQGLRYREIASQLGISSNSVGTLLLRAMRKMRAARAESILRSVRESAPSV